MVVDASELKVVENFSLLEAMHPGRIDLGIGRAAGTDNVTAYALPRKLYSHTIFRQFDELLSFFLNRDFPSDHPYHGIIPIPNDGNHTLMPAIYMLDSSTGGVQFAMSEGLGFAFASHLAPHLATQVLRGYRNNFKPSKYLSEPKGITTISATDEEARYLLDLSYFGRDYIRVTFIHHFRH